MATKKAGGTAKNLTDSQPKFLGVKLYAGEKAKIGDIIIRQRGTVVLAGTNVAVGKDHTLFAMKPGTVEFGQKRKKNFDGTSTTRKIVHVK
jgi:large subunit ribosomal protein L27